MEKTWCYFQNEQNVWAYGYGYLAADRVVDIDAVVEKLANGSWRWYLMHGTYQGIEPNAEGAKQRALRELTHRNQ